MMPPKEQTAWKSLKPLANLGGQRAQVQWDDDELMPRFAVECHKRCARGGHRTRYVYRADTLADAYFDAGNVITAGVDI
jgi:hypothetical protein